MSDPSTQSLLSGRSLGLDYPTHPGALDGVDVELVPARLTFLLGPNGAGKSTLLRLLAGFRRPSRGRVALADGAAPSELPAAERARRIAYLPQRIVSELGLRVQDIVAMGRFAHAPARLFESDEDRGAVASALDLLSLSGLASRPFGELSGGEQQRVSLARVLCQQARVLLMDEPTTGLDPAHQTDFLTRLRELVRSRSLAALVSAHDMVAASRYADAVILLKDGRQLAFGAPEEVLQPDVLEAAFEVSFEMLRGEHTGAALPVPLAQRRRPTADR